MADRSIPIIRASDATIIKFFDQLRDHYQFNQNYNIYIIGSDSPLSIGSSQVQTLKKQKGRAIRQVSIARSNAYITYERSTDVTKFNVPDVIRISNNNNALNFDDLLAINALISKSFEETVPGGAPANPEILEEVVSSHQQIIMRLEESLERVSARFAEERLRIQSEQDTFIRQKQDEFANRESALREEVAKERQALATRERDLDDRTNTHARRGIRADMKRRLQEHATKFTLTEKTRQLRWPIHAITLLASFILVLAIAYYTQQYDYITREALTSISKHGAKPGIEIPASLLYPPLIKGGILSFALLGLIAWYIRWLNRWFDQHAVAEFNLKQFELDVDRASWVVETAMEWRSSQHGVIPTHLLQSISKNLFSSKEQQKDENIHPADYLASAIFGSAANAKIKVGDSEIELDRKSLRKMENR